MAGGSPYKFFLVNGQRESISNAKRKFGSDKKILRSKFVFSVTYNQKTKAIKRFRCRLVVMGFMAEEESDYDQTFAAIPRHSSWRVLSTVAVEHGWPIQSYDSSS